MGRTNRKRLQSEIRATAASQRCRKLTENERTTSTVVVVVVMITKL